MPHFFTKREAKTTDQYMSELERRLRRGLSPEKADEIVGEVQAHLRDAARDETVEGANRTQTERDLPRRFGTPARYARCVMDSAYSDPVSVWGRRTAGAMGTFLLLSALLFHQSIPRFMQVFWFLNGASLRSLLFGSATVLCSSFLLSAFVGKRAHLRLWAACGLLCFLVIGIDGGLHYVIGPFGPMSRPNPVYATWEKSPEKPDATPLLLQGTQTYAASHPHVPAALRWEKTFIVPRPFDTQTWSDRDLNGIFRHKSQSPRIEQLWQARRDRDNDGDWTEAGTKRWHDFDVRMEKELLRIASSAPYRTVANIEEATRRWRADGPLYLDALRKDHMYEQELKAAFDKANRTPPGFQRDAAVARVYLFWWVPCLIALAEAIMAAFGRITFRRLLRGCRLAR